VTACLLLAVDSTGRRNTSISFFLLGFESQGVAHIACDPKVPGFSAAAKSSKNPRRIGIHSVFLLQDKKCCVDRLNPPPKADIARLFDHLVSDLLEMQRHV